MEKKSPQQSITLSSLKDSLKPLITFSKKHFRIVFVSIVLGTLVYATFTVRSILDSPLPVVSSDSNSTYSTKFNEKTIEKINSLGSGHSSTTLPSGRINPFSE